MVTTMAEEDTTAYLNKDMEEETGRGIKYGKYAHNDLDSRNANEDDKKKQQNQGLDATKPELGNAEMQEMDITDIKEQSDEHDAGR